MISRQLVVSYRVVENQCDSAGRISSVEIAPNPEMIDNENPEWTDSDFRNSVPFSELPEELKTKLASAKDLSPDKDSESNQPAA